MTYKLGDGQIAAVGMGGLTDENARLAIVGGTGAYAGARGTIKTTKPMQGDDSSDVITISG